MGFFSRGGGGGGVLLIIFGKCIEISNFHTSILDSARIFINYDIMFYKDEGVSSNTPQTHTFILL